ncbi:ATP-dependent zinc metalloprotease FtsH [Desulforhopalus sp. IMCC35007]|uniref:ATP-dependent zinc metalloprotease FtsH n=1 Tax=Desulforhopalus sp. IMCC35007 TaxID=2569543 RepID=UPI0010AE9DFE|nr:ATP-dependent zinc metalloprotease FtsH [Desulforhopalus sp. IMCC35007]TKB08338.1 ATP-dependent zinc metalloprotease FtsH [Desulforhopalus sp. IMCC35007]
MNTKFQAGLILTGVTLVGLLFYNVWLIETTPPNRPYSTFINQLQEERIRTVELTGGKIQAVDTTDNEFITYGPDIPALMPILLQSGVILTTKAPPSNLQTFAPLILWFFILSILWGYLTRKSSAKNEFTGNNRFPSAKQITGKKTFEDVAGIDEVREELVEIIDFLKHQEKYSQLGGRIPSGVLLQGPPGTGKTLLARALAGEASVPFFSLGGSDFVEMFAGVGASRVRELFQMAKKNAPCIVFIDEIDAIGGKRSGGMNGSHEEREQTLNALLVEMDGFSSHDKTVIIVGATNRPDILDPALLRPGRFDRQLTVSLPNLKGRIKILDVHTRNVITASGMSLAHIAQGIPGFSGADIANLVNEAALIAARKEKKAVELVDFEEAKDKIIMGLERKNAAINDNERRIIAYHEAGHAIVAALLPETDRLHKITIIPRGQALGLTQQIPFEEHYTYSLVYLLNRIKVLLGGRISEEIVFKQLSTGASNDIAGATAIARRIVSEWGMSSAMGAMVYHSQTANQPASPLSEKTTREIDLEIRRIIRDCYSQTEALLRQHNTLIHELAELLLVNETVDGEEVDIVIQCYLNRNENKKKTDHICHRSDASADLNADEGADACKESLQEEESQ